MADTVQAAATSPDLAQARELSLLVELEACWENLRKTPGRPAAAYDTRDLATIQKAYDAFRTKLAAYNRRYTPPHVPERMLNTPVRLVAWCRAMKQLYLHVSDDHRAQPPVHLLEKTYRWADRVSLRLKTDRADRPTPPATISAAIEQLEAVAQWCDRLVGAAPAVAETSAPSNGHLSERQFPQAPAETGLAESPTLSASTPATTSSSAS
jgi:hypothetical protein